MIRSVSLTLKYNKAMIGPHNILTKCPGGKLLPFLSLSFHSYVNFVQRVFLKWWWKFLYPSASLRLLLFISVRVSRFILYLVSVPFRKGYRGLGVDYMDVNSVHRVEKNCNYMKNFIPGLNIIVSCK